MGIDEEANMLKNGAKDEAVELFQAYLEGWKGDSLPKFGPDGGHGGVTAALLTLDSS